MIIDFIKQVLTDARTSWNTIFAIGIFFANVTMLLIITTINMGKFLGNSHPINVQCDTSDEVCVVYITDPIYGCEYQTIRAADNTPLTAPTPRIGSACFSSDSVAQVNIATPQQPPVTQRPPTVPLSDQQYYDWKVESADVCKLFHRIQHDERINCLQARADKMLELSQMLARADE